jgi:predicted DNA binding CopG/RHH family protein
MAKPNRSLKPIPEFASEAAERRFWETHDSAAYVDWSSAGFVRFPNLKPSTETISLRLPAGLLADLKALANKQDVPYQSLLKVFLADRVAREWRAVGPQGPQSANKAVQPTTRARRKALSPKPSRAARG